jgi:integrase
MTPQAIWYMVEQYAPVEGLAPHDLRRTFAKLADKAGAPLAQIQKTLGHASIQTTERYVGNDLDLQNAPADMVRLDIAK